MPHRLPVPRCCPRGLPAHLHRDVAALCKVHKQFIRETVYVRNSLFAEQFIRGTASSRLSSALLCDHSRARGGRGALDRRERQELVGSRRLADAVLGGVRGAEAEVAGPADVRGGDVLEAVVAERRGRGGRGGGVCRHAGCAWVAGCEEEVLLCPLPAQGGFARCGGPVGLQLLPALPGRNVHSGSVLRWEGQLAHEILVAEPCAGQGR